MTVGRTVAALVGAVLTVGACTTSVPGTAVRASGEQRPPSRVIPARDLLLQEGETTPLGSATAAPITNNYFTSARPAECSAAMLFEGSPLRPAGSSDHAESSYRFGGDALYAESIDVYDNDVKPNDVVRSGFSTVSGCQGDAFGIAPSGEFGPMRLSFFATPADGVLTWTMTRPDWTCDYGLAVVPTVVLLVSVCDSKPGFPMTDWAQKRRAQLDSRA